jgi:putative oxidoreductase
MFSSEARAPQQSSGGLFCPTSRALADLAPLPLRLIVGYGFFAHGYAKLSRGPEGFAHVLDILGVPAPLLMSWVTTLVELVGGIAVLAGAFIPLVSIPMGVVLITAMFTVHYQYGFFSVKLAEVTPAGTKFGPVGYEIILLYLGGLVTLAIGGAGRFSIDALLRRLWQKER